MKIFSNQTANKLISAFLLIWLCVVLFGFGVRIATQHTVIDIIANYFAVASDYAKTAKTFSQNTLFAYKIAQIPQTCPTCKDKYEEQIYFLATNTGELHPLIIAPYLNEGTATLTAIYDKISQTRVDIFQDYYYGVSANIHKKLNIVNIPRIKAIFCEDCSQKLLTAIKRESITSFLLFLPEDKAFYPIRDGLKMQIGDYTLSVSYDNKNDNMDITLCFKL